MDNVSFSNRQWLISVGVNVRDANAVGSQLMLNFCLRVAPRLYFEASQRILKF